MIDQKMMCALKKIETDTIHYYDKSITVVTIQCISIGPIFSFNTFGIVAAKRLFAVQRLAMSEHVYRKQQMELNACQL